MKPFFEQSLDPYIADARLITDDPQELLEKVSSDQQVVVNEMRDALAAAEREIYIFTPYFIPGKRGIAFIKELRVKGKRIR